MEKRARAPSPDLGVFAVTTKSPDALTESTNCQKRRVRTGQVRLHCLTDFQASPRLDNSWGEVALRCSFAAEYTHGELFHDCAAS